MTPIVSRSELSRRRHFTRRSGAIAQLGERVVRNDEVGGSIPPGSTSLRSLRLGKPGKCLVAKRAKAATPWPEGRRRASNHSGRGHEALLLRRFRYRHVRHPAQPAIEKMLQPGTFGDVVAGAPGKVLVARMGAWHVQTFGAARRPAAHHRVGHVGMKLKAESISGTKGLHGEVTAFRQ